MEHQYFKTIIENREKPKRVTLSARFPILAKPTFLIKSNLKNLLDHLRYRLASRMKKDFYPCVIARHQSVLVRQLGDSDPELQMAKIENLQKACKDLNGLVIKPGEVFSMWKVIGQPTYKRGYVDGMLLSNGRVVTGVGGGLCQLSNFLCWIFLHADTEVIERSHHSYDVFPDSGRVLPFGSGATCLYNLLDLKFKNTSDQPLQLKIKVTPNHLKGQLVSPEPRKLKYSVVERNHTFVKSNNHYYRYNEIWKTAKQDGQIVGAEKVFTNLAPVLYHVTPNYLLDRKYELIDLTPKIK